MSYDKANNVNFVKFLSHLHKKHGKFVMFVDNATYHKSAMVHKALEGFGGDAVLEYFPPHTPELNRRDTVEGDQKGHRQRPLRGDR